MTEASTTTTDQAPAGGCGCGGCGCGGGGAAQAAPGAADAGLALVTGGSGIEPGDVDLRGLPPQERHERVRAAVAALLPGEGFVLANDHDPQRLRAELEKDETGRLSWTYLASGPVVWRVLIGRETCC